MMYLNGDTRSQDWSSERDFDLEQQRYPTNRQPSATAGGSNQSGEMISTIRRGFRMKRLKGGSPNFYPDSRSRKVLHPESQFIQLWNNIFAFSCLISVALDPLFLYMPVIDNSRKCLDLDNKLKITACIIRSVVILIIAPRVNATASTRTRSLMTIAVFSQYVPRLLQIYPLPYKRRQASRIFPDTPWSGAAFNLFLYMVASNALGALWYLFTIYRVHACWDESCATHHQYCHSEALYCAVARSGNYSFLNSSCLFLEPNEIKQPADYFNFGIYLEALQSGVVEKRHFWRKFFYCFWWGLRNLSSMGQNLSTSNFIGENVFAISIAVIGLVLFALLIGNMQQYLQSISTRIDEMRLKRLDRKKVEQWMSHRMLPENLRRRVRRYEEYKWQGTRGIQEDALIKNLPKDLRRDINRHHWFALRRVPLFEKMDDRLMDALCDRLKPVLYTEDSYIYREGDPVDEMLFLTRGNLLSTTTYGGRTGFFNSVCLAAGDFCGEEILTWALDPNSGSSLPTSTRTVQAVKDVEAFALKADDLRFLASQFVSLNGDRVRHISRFHSQHWRLWAACFIQAAWRRYLRKKLDKSLLEMEDGNLRLACCHRE